MMREPTWQYFREGRRRGGVERHHPTRSRRGSGDGMSARGDGTQHGKPRGVKRYDLQPDAREGQAGPHGVADRPVIPSKPGNSGGGKGPDFGSGLEVGRIGRVTMLSITSNKRFGTTEGPRDGGEGAVSCRFVCRLANPVGEPDAGNPPVRFDEREVETEQGGILWHRQPKGPATRMAYLNHRATSRLYQPRSKTRGRTSFSACSAA
jgi:hypothetical protein